MKPKYFKNRREAEIFRKYHSEGFELLYKGWPDFLIYKDGEIMMIEVKRKQKRPSKKMGLSAHQRRMKEILEKHFKYEVVYVD